MNHTVFCIKLKHEAEAMVKAPFPGALGEKILTHVSLPAWNMWLAHQTMLINEYRLSLSDAQSRTFLKEELQKYFFGEGSSVPAGFTES